MDQKLSLKETFSYFWQHVIARMNGFLSTSGGTVDGNVKVNGTVEAEKVIGAVYQ